MGECFRNNAAQCQQGVQEVTTWQWVVSAHLWKTARSEQHRVLPYLTANPRGIWSDERCTSIPLQKSTLLASSSSTAMYLYPWEPRRRISCHVQTWTTYRIHIFSEDFTIFYNIVHSEAPQWLLSRLGLHHRTERHYSITSTNNSIYEGQKGMLV